MSEPPPARARTRIPQLGSGGDRVFRVIILLLASVIVLVFGLSLYELYTGSAFVWQNLGLSYVFGNAWNPVTGNFGVLPMIVGTLLTSVLALLISVPLAIASAIFVSEYAPKWLAEPVSYLVELLAAVPSVVYGLWALFFLRDIIQRIQLNIFTNNPELVTLCSDARYGDGAGNWRCLFVPEAPTGLGLLLAVIILSIMIIPFTAAVARDVIRLVPREQREAMYALGATRWEVISRAILPYARAGIIGGVILALGRALGETLAVAMVIGNTPDFVNNIWGTTATMASQIANEFGDAQTPAHLGSVIGLGFMLFVVSVLVNYAARLIIARLTPKGIQ